MAIAVACSGDDDASDTPAPLAGSNELARYADAVCDLQRSQLDGNVSILESAGLDLDAESLETRRGAALSVFSSLRDSGRLFSAELDQLSPPNADRGYQAALIDDAAAHGDVLEQALAGAGGAETHQALDGVLERYVTWLETTGGSAGSTDRAMTAAGEELRRAIVNAPTCRPLFE